MRVALVAVLVACAFGFERSRRGGRAERSLRDPGRRVARVRPGNARPARRGARPARSRHRARDGLLEPDRAGAGPLRVAPIRSAPARAPCARAGARRDALGNSGLGVRGRAAERRPAPERRLLAIRPGRRNPLPVRPELDHVERAEQDRLAQPRLAACVCDADPQPRLSGDQSGEPRGEGRRGSDGAERRQGRNGPRGLHQGDGSCGGAPRRVRAPSLSQLSGRHAVPGGRVR